MRAAARPGSNSYSVYLLGFIMDLFSTNATPAVARGLSGCCEVTTSSLPPKQDLTCCSESWSRWVSCRASIAMRLSLIVRLMADHFSIPDMLFAGAV